MMTLVNFSHLQHAAQQKQDLRYGENSTNPLHFMLKDIQEAVATAEQLQGKELSLTTLPILMRH